MGADAASDGDATPSFYTGFETAIVTLFIGQTKSLTKETHPSMAMTDALRFSGMLNSNSLNIYIHENKILLAPF